MKYIIAILLLTSTLSAQTKWRQIERSNIKWQVPAAFDSIPGVTGYASKYIGLETLIDTLGIEFPVNIDSLVYRNDTLFLYIGAGYYFTIIEGGGGSGYLNPYVVSGDTVGFILQTVQDTVEIVGASTGGGGGGGSGTVTSVELANGGGISISGTNPITTSGTITLLTAVDQSATNEIQQIDTFQIVGSQLRLSLEGDGEPYKSVTLPSGGGGAVDTIIAGDGIIVDISGQDYTVSAQTAQYAQLDLGATSGTSINLTAATYKDVEFLSATSSTDITATYNAGGRDYIKIITGGTCEFTYSVSITIPSGGPLIYFAIKALSGGLIEKSKSYAKLTTSGVVTDANFAKSYIDSCNTNNEYNLQVYSSSTISGVTVSHQTLTIKKIK